MKIRTHTRGGLRANLILGLLLAFFVGIAVAFAAPAMGHVTTCDMFGVPENGWCLDFEETGPYGTLNLDPEHVVCYHEVVDDGPGSSVGHPHAELTVCPLPPLDDSEFTPGGQAPPVTEREPLPGPDPASAPAEIAALDTEIALRTAGIIITALIAGGLLTAAGMMRRWNREHDGEWVA